MNLDLAIQRADAGIAYCEKKFGKPRMMRIKPVSLDQSKPRNCLFAQASQTDYTSAVQAHGLTEDEEIKYGFIGSFDSPVVAADTDDLVTTDEMTDIVRERLELYQAKQHELAAAKHRFAFLDFLRTLRPAPKFTRPA